MRLNETEMVKLLPAWMQEDGSDKGIATGCNIISRDAYARLKLLSRWDKIDQLSDAELDEMAWELNIQWYDSTAPIAANGDMHAALDYAAKIKHAQKDFLTSQGIHAIID